MICKYFEFVRFSHTVFALAASAIQNARAPVSNATILCD